MKIACDKCLKVEEIDRATKWLKVSTVHTQFNLCSDCEDGFWLAVDHSLPKIVEEKIVHCVNCEHKDKYSECPASDDDTGNTSTYVKFCSEGKEKV